MSTNYNWAEINERLVHAIRPTSSAVAMKFIKHPDELQEISNVIPWKQTASVCHIVGLSAYWNITVSLTGEYMKVHCGGNNGLRKREEEWHAGVALNSDPIKWHGTREASATHMRAMLEDIPSDDHYAIVTSPLASGDIPNPDAIIISSEPGAAFYVFAGLVESDWQEIGFTFRGESTCAETWCRTYTSGRPGLSLGCRGDRCNGALGGHEVRFSISPADLLKALEGMERLEKDGVQYPFWPAGIINVPQLKKDAGF